MLQKFIFTDLPVRGALVRLDADWQSVLQRGERASLWHPRVTELMGQLAAAACLLQSSIRFHGKLTVQIVGDGPLSLAIAEVQHHADQEESLPFRVSATVADAASIAPAASLRDLIHAQGLGHCAITLQGDQAQQAYQGLVALSSAGENMAQVLEAYMQQSQQLETTFVLAANAQAAAGLLVQRMPLAGQGNLAEQQHSMEEEEALQAYQHLRTLGLSLQAQELLELPFETILHRLYWQESVQLFAPLGTPFSCSCSRERVERMVLG